MRVRVRVVRMGKQKPQKTTGGRKDDAKATTQQYQAGKRSIKQYPGVSARKLSPVKMM